jgi:cation transport regulator
VLESIVVPYARNSDLPAPVRRVLPRHAQDIYRAAFNDAFERYGGDREAIAHRVAWAAVKRRYIHRAAGIWVARDKAA